MAFAKILHRHIFNYSIFSNKAYYNLLWCRHMCHKEANSLSSRSSLIDTNQRLKLLFESGRINDARNLFDKMPKRDKFTYNTMVTGYANAGKLDEAQQVFDKTPNKCSITWSALISGYCKLKYENEGFDLFWKMQYKGHKPSQFTLGTVLRLCSIKGFLQKGEEIHGYVIKTCFNNNAFVATGLIDMYVKCLRVKEAEYLFKMMSNGKNHVTWSAMINGYSLNGDMDKTIECFKGMREEGIEANQYTFPSVLGAVFDLRFGAQVHACVIHGGFINNVFVQSALIDMYSKCGDLSYARKVLESINVNHVVSWNTMIIGYVRNGFENEALYLFELMHKRDMEMDEFTYPSILNAIALNKDVKIGKSVHCLVVKTGFIVYNLISNALVDMYAKHGELNCALKVFDIMKQKDVISWTSIVTGYAYNKSYEEAIKSFKEMRNLDIKCDEIVYSSVLSSCMELALLQNGQQIHADYIKSGFKTSLSVNNSLIAMYANCGCLEDALTVFNLTKIRNVITWTAIIIGYAQNGKGKESIEFYNKMIENGIIPDFITFIGLLFACSHAGLVNKGKQYFQDMKKIYKIKPSSYHYACMIDLLARSNNMNEAEILLNEMEIEPDATVWKALLSACRIHKNVKLAKKAASELFNLNPKDSVPYVMLSNIYSALGKWDEAKNIRKLMKLKGVIKEPGCSWIEMNSEVYSFISEDRSYLKGNEINEKIDEIMMLIKKEGYVVDMNFALHDVNEEGKERVLAYHSEKVAVAFGLLYLPKGAVIRVFKNIRVCGDCHTAMKFISRVYDRCIVLRDCNCFHHFRDGECSCGDYW